MLSSVTSALGPVAVLPYSAALTNQTTGEVLGVATANITLTASTTNLFDFPNTVYYVMTAKGSNFLLLSNSVGESLDANGSLFPAYKAQNMVIRKSAEFVAQLTNIPSKGAYYTVEGGNASMVFAVAPCTDATNTLHVLVVTATYLPSVFTPTNSTTCSDGSVAPQASLVGPELTADVLATYAGIMLDQSITFGKSIAFLAGGGAPLNLSPYPILLNDNDSSSLQILRGMMNAYGFPYGNDFVRHIVAFHRFYREIFSLMLLFCVVYVAGV